MKNVRLHQGQWFVAYRLPFQTEEHLIIQSDEASPSSSDSGFLIRPFYTREKKQTIQIRADQYFMNTPFSFSYNSDIKNIVIEKSNYLNDVQRIQSMLLSDEEKIVYSRVKKNTQQITDWYPYFKKACDAYPNAFVYIINMPEIGAWFGASPELLLQWNDHHARTMALAGTRPRGTSVPWSAKNQDEQAIVARFIKDILTKSTIQCTSIKNTTMAAGKVEHLCTTFSFDTPDDIYDVLEQLHPTPAVCGHPKKNALHQILQVEQHDRKYYCGFLGPIGLHDENYLFVNLRCMELSADAQYLYVGGGIMKDSDAEAEWAETEHKAKTLLSIMNTVL